MQVLENPPKPDSTAAWDQYWRDGRLASCGGEGDVNYQPAIADGWCRFFGTLTDGAHILDICTGNGAVARLAAEVAAAGKHNVTIEAVDSAALNPTGSGSGVDMIRFSSRIQAEDLPFPDGTFNAIVGQYAIEYTDIERTLTELKRVSQPAVRIRFVTHAAGSIVVQETQQQLADVEQLTATGIFEAAETLVRARETQMAATSWHDARRNFRHAVQALQDATTRAVDLRMYNNVGAVITHAIQQQAHLGSGPVLAKIVETASAIAAHAARLSAMRCAALDESGAQALATRAEQLWARKFALDSLTRSNGALLGWVLESSSTGD